MNILFSSDNNYAIHLAVSIYSIIVSNKNEKINFYIIDLDIDDSNKNIINRLIYSSENTINYIKVSNEEFKDFPKTIDYISLATYARLKVASYLKELDKIIYIDVDTLTNGSLKELWETDLGEKWIAACFDSFVEYEDSSHKATIGLTNEQKYFNAGVLIINLVKWRTVNVFGKAIKWVEKNKRYMKYLDQDILNGLFKDKVHYLDCRFNFMPNHISRLKYYRRNKLVVDDVEKTTMPVVISHYCGPEKAWHVNCFHINSHLYNKLLKKIKSNPKELSDLVETLNIFVWAKKLKKSIYNRIKYKIY